MIYTNLCGDRIRISLKRGEMIKLFGSEKRLCEGCADTKAALGLLLEKAVTECGFNAENGDVLVEIVGNISGGCDIYFVKEKVAPKLKGSKNAPTVFEFESCQKAILAARAFILKGYSPAKSHFFKTEKGFYILAPCGLGHQQTKLLKGFAKRVYSLNLAAAVVEEYGERLIADHAILTLSRL